MVCYAIMRYAIKAIVLSRCSTLLYIILNSLINYSFPNVHCKAALQKTGNVLNRKYANSMQKYAILKTLYFNDILQVFLS